MTTVETTDLVVRPIESSSIFTTDGFDATMKICEALVKSGILPRGVDNAYKAFAIVQKGREIGVGPMRALTGIHLIEGKPVVSPELKLEQFRERGGRVKWHKKDPATGVPYDENAKAHLWLKAPNGDEHDEIVTIEDMRAAGVAGKDNWRKYPKSMLRARAVGFGLRALGEGDGSYTPDELGAVTDEDGNVSDVRDLRERIERDSDSRRGAAEAAGPPVAGTASPSPAGTKRRDSGAKDIKHDGSVPTKGQIDKIHALRAKSPTLSATPEHPHSNWKKKLAPYKRQDGTPCQHSNELSYGQASHLIDWMQAKVDALDAKEREIRGTPANDTGTVEATDPRQAFYEQLANIFPTATEQGEWMESIGFADASQCPDNDDARLAVLQLAAAYKRHAPTYADWITKAREKGYIP